MPRRPLLATLVLALAGCSPTPGPQARAAPVKPPPRPAPAAPPISVSLLIPDQMHGNSLNLADLDCHVDVVLQNVSDRPQRVWAEWCSWGWYNVSLRVVALNGKPLSAPILLGRGPRGWRANFPDAVTLTPGGQIVREVRFRDLYSGRSDHAPGLPFPPARRLPFDNTATMQAVFEGTAGELGRAVPGPLEARYGVWPGKTLSPPVTVMVNLPVPTRPREPFHPRPVRKR